MRANRTTSWWHPVVNYILQHSLAIHYNIMSYVCSGELTEEVRRQTIFGRREGTIILGMLNMMKLDERHTRNISVWILVIIATLSDIKLMI